MARVTIEDCLEKFDNHFKVVQVAAHRARQLELGSPPLVPPDDDKSTVIALREISEGKITEDILDEPLIEKNAWEQTDPMIIQPQDLGSTIADIENYADINETSPKKSKATAEAMEATDELAAELTAVDKLATDAPTDEDTTDSIEANGEQSSAENIELLAEALSDISYEEDSPASDIAETTEFPDLDEDPSNK